MKRLWDENGKYINNSETQGDIAYCSSLIHAVFYKMIERGYNPRDIELYIMQDVGNIAAEHVLMETVKRREKERQDAKIKSLESKD